MTNKTSHLLQNSLLLILLTIIVLLRRENTNEWDVFSPQPTEPFPPIKGLYRQLLPPEEGDKGGSTRKTKF